MIRQQKTSQSFSLRSLVCLRGYGSDWMILRFGKWYDYERLKRSFFVLIFCFIFYFFFWFTVLVQARSDRCWKGGWLVLQKWEQKEERRKREKKRKEKTPKSLAVGERMDEHDFWIFFPSFSIFSIISYFDIDDIHFVLASRPVTNHAHVFFFSYSTGVIVI